MLTGIYVCSTMTLTFTTTEPVVLVSYDQRRITATGSPLQATVTQGIYKVQTNDAIHTSPASATDLSIFEAPSFKDPIPDPPGFASEMKMFTDLNSLDTFFAQQPAKSAAFPTSAPAR